MSQHLPPLEEHNELEVQLRNASPALPPALRSRTLRHCAALQDEQGRNGRRGHLRWAWKVAGLCAFHWCAMSYLDAQSTALIHGTNPAPLIAAATTSAAELRVALEAHSRLLAKMTRETARPAESTHNRDAG